MPAMELLQILLLSLLISVLLFFVVFHYGDARGTTKHLNLPPGSLSRLPLIGDAFSFYKPHYSLSANPFLLQRVRRYGSIFKISLFGEPTIVSADREFSRFVLQSEPRAFASSYPSSVISVLGKWAIGFQTGELHQTLRSNLNSLVHGTNLRDRVLPVADREASLVLDSWVKHRSSLSAADECKKFSFNVIARYALRTVAADEEYLRMLRAEFGTFTDGMAALPLDLPGTSYRRALQARSSILKLLEKKLEETNEDEIEEAGEGFCSVLAKNTNLTTEQMLEVLTGLLFAAHSTVVDALSLALYFLNLCPEAGRQLQEEHGAILEAKRQKGERTLTWHDYKQMDFTLCVINETLRLGSIAKIVYRRAIRDVRYKGFDIPNGWKVIPVISSVDIDPSSYEDHLAFNPWRWKEESTSTNNKNMMAFGYGPRLCPGSELAKLEMAVFLHHLVRRYNWEPVGEDSPMLYPYIRFPKGFPIKVFPR